MISRKHGDTIRPHDLPIRYRNSVQVQHLVIMSRNQGPLNFLRFADPIFTRTLETGSPLTSPVISVTYLREASKMAETGCFGRDDEKVSA